MMKRNKNNQKKKKKKNVKVNISDNKGIINMYICIGKLCNMACKVITDK
jgi:hypothetical protein